MRRGIKSIFRCCVFVSFLLITISQFRQNKNPEMPTTSFLLKIKELVTTSLKSEAQNVLKSTQIQRDEIIFTIKTSQSNQKERMELLYKTWLKGYESQVRMFKRWSSCHTLALEKASAVETRIKFYSRLLDIIHNYSYNLICARENKSNAMFQATISLLVIN